MNISIINLNEVSYIYPKNADLLNNNHLISINKFNVKDTHRFSSIIGYSRLLMSLDQSLSLKVNAFENNVDKHTLIRFKSEDDAKVCNSATLLDFMLKEDISNFNINNTSGFISTKDVISFIYVYNRQQVFINSKTYELNKDDLLIIENYDRENVDIISNQEICLLHVNLAHHEVF